MPQMPETLPAENDLPPERHFEIHAVFSEEQKRLGDWLESEASDALGAPSATEESAYVRAEKLVSQIREGYCTKHDLNPRLLVAAQDGTLQTYVPARSAIATYGVLRFIAMGLEVSLAVLVWMMGQAQPVFIAVTVILALGGYLLGSGVGGIFERRWKASLPPAMGVPTKEAGLGFDLAKAIGGGVIVVGISYLRSIDEEGSAVIFVVGVPLLLALLITLFESLHHLLKGKYLFLKERMSRAQRWYAIENHGRALETYRAQYVSKVKEISLQMRRAASNG